MLFMIFQTWYEAVVQSFFSLSVGFGALITYSSYNQETLSLGLFHFINSVHLQFYMFFSHPFTPPLQLNTQGLEVKLSLEVQNHYKPIESGCSSRTMSTVTPSSYLSPTPVPRCSLGLSSFPSSVI